jgi:hypothetical protein
MKIVKDRIILEQIALEECGPGDKIEFFWNPIIRIWGKAELLKIKKIPKNKTQIKYRPLSTWHGRINPVKKVDLPAGTIVLRARMADARDCTVVKECNVEILA